MGPGQMGTGQKTAWNFYQTSFSPSPGLEGGTKLESLRYCNCNNAIFINTFSV